MKIVVAIASFTAGCSLMFNACFPAAAGEAWPPLSARQIKIYHECLAAAWIDEWCRDYAHRVDASFDRAYPACVAANHGRPYLLRGQYWDHTDDYCAYEARHR